MEDGLNFLLENGLSPDDVEKLLGDGIPMEEIVDSAKRMIARGEIPTNNPSLPFSLFSSSFMILRRLTRSTPRLFQLTAFRLQQRRLWMSCQRVHRPRRRCRQRWS